MYNPDGIPSILVGDMNAAMDDASSKTLRTHWNDSFLTVESDFISGPVGTFNGHKSQPTSRRPRRASTTSTRAATWS